MPGRSDHPTYSIHPSVAHGQAILRNLPDKTGRSLAEWERLIRKAAPQGTKERREWLKREHQIGGVTARLIVDRADGTGHEDSDERSYLSAAPGYVDAMYAGPKEALRPIHDALIELALIEIAPGLSGDLRICPCKTIVPLYRNHVFAQIKPATRSRVDLGLGLKGAKKGPGKRLIDTGGLAKGDRITHRFALSSVDEIDNRVRDWLTLAYELDA